MKAKKRYCTIYRFGTREDPKWSRTLPFDTYEEAHEYTKETQALGYHAFTEDYDASLRIGLPEGWEYNTRKS